MNIQWPEIDNLERVASPGLLVDAEKVANNIQAMVAMVDGRADRLRPHVKTHKMPKVVELQVAAGITRFKAATIAEANMVAGAGGKDVLLAYQTVGPNIDRLANLVEQFPDTLFSAVTDDTGIVDAIAKRFSAAANPLPLYIDVDCGMHRTGIEIGPKLEHLRRHIESTAHVRYAGLHVYDGHLHMPSLEERRSAAHKILAVVRDYDRGNPSPTIIGGGSPTFASWATESAWQCSPGTPVFWDVGYGDAYADLGFSIAIALLTRVISKPGGNRICLDLGYKAVASEMPLERRVSLPTLDVTEFDGHSEEHLVVETPRASEISLGQPFLAFPRHVCPTVALHSFATVVRQRHVTDETWPVTVRDR